MNNTIKRLLVAVLLVLCMCAAVVLTACDITSDGDSNNEIRMVYNLYVANAEQNGETPLTYEAWLLSIRGEKGDKGDNGKDGIDGKNGLDGVGIKSVDIDSEGNLVITFTDGKIANIGKVVGRDGQQGEKGENGVPGKDGNNGKDGMSAYELYKKYHPEYTGTEEEWLEMICGSTDDDDLFDYMPLDDGTYAVECGHAYYLSVVEIPAYHKGKAVTAIYDFNASHNGSWDYINEYQKEITLPSTLKILGGYAFHGFTSVTKISFQGTVEQWNTVQKYDGWCRSLQTTTIECQNGTVAINCPDGHTWQNGICTVCGSMCVHDNWDNGACTKCGIPCPEHNWSSASGYCTNCHKACEHDFVDGVCTICKMKSPIRSIKDIRLNWNNYQGEVVVLEGQIICNAKNTVYVQQYDDSTKMYYGISVFYGYNMILASVEAQEILTPGNTVRVCGLIDYSEDTKNVWMSDVVYQPDVDDIWNLKLIEKGTTENCYIETAIERFDDIVSIDGKELIYSDLVLDTGVLVKNLEVVDISRVGSSGMIITCTKDNKTISVRTNTIYNNITIGSIITVKGIVGYDNSNLEDGATPICQIRVFGEVNITIVS